jgi:hypothetical protein
MNIFKNDELGSLFAMLSVEVFNIKEKLTDGEYLDINNKLKNLYTKVQDNKKQKLKLFKMYNKLLQDYVKMSNCFTHQYDEIHACEDDFIEFVNIE